MTKLPAPKNRIVDIAKIVIERLVEGLGVDIAVAAATAEVPWLAYPVIKQLFRFAVEQVAEVINQNLFNFTAIMVIRLQNLGRLKDFQDSMKPFLIPGQEPTDEEIQAARDAIDRLVNRNRP